MAVDLKHILGSSSGTPGAMATKMRDACVWDRQTTVSVQNYSQIRSVHNRHCDVPRLDVEYC